MTGLFSRLKKIKNKKLVFLLSLFLVTLPNLASAQSLKDLVVNPGKFFSDIILALSSLIASIVGAMIALVVYFITAILLLSFNLSNSAFVARGFQASLSIVNLGFVLSLIVIAIATILRVESYAMKRTLRNFILAAFLVNFSLVIAGSVIKFGDNITLYIIQSGFPANDNAGSISNFATSMGRAFAPHRYIQVTNKSGEEIANDPKIKAIVSDDPADSTEILPALVSLLTTVMGLTLALVAMGALFVMLLYRYVLLTGLLIVMPFAWLLWIFPSTSIHWRRWWGKFLGQVFFPPVALFGVWLVVVIGISMNTGDSTILPGASNLEASITNWLGVTFASTINTFLKGIVLSGLMLGSLSFAAKMGEESAQVGMQWAQGAKNAYVGYVGGRAREYGRRTANRAYDAKVPFTQGARPIKSAVSGLQSIGASDNKLLKWTGTSLLAGKAGRLADRAVSANRESLVTEARDKSKNLSVDEKIRNFGAASYAEQLAWTADINKEGRLTEVKDIDKFLDKDNEENFKTHGQDKVFKDARDETGMTYEYLRKEISDLKKSDKFKTPQEKEVAIEKKEKELDQHLSGLSDPHKVAKLYFSKTEHDLDVDEKAELKKEGKKVPKAPHGLSDTELAEAREDMLRRMTLRMSSRVISKVMQEATKLDEENLIKEAGERLRFKDPQGYDEAKLNGSVRNWFNSTGAKNLGVDLSSIGLGRNQRTGGSNQGGQQQGGSSSGNSGGSNQGGQQQGGSSSSGSSRQQRRDRAQAQGSQLIPINQADKGEYDTNTIVLGPDDYRRVDDEGKDDSKK